MNNELSTEKTAKTVEDHVKKIDHCIDLRKRCNEDNNFFCTVC